MKTACKLLICVGIFSMLTPCLAQDPNALYGIYNNINGDYYFSKVDLVTGARTDLCFASTSIGSDYSADVNAQDGLYYFCTGDSVLTFDAVNGTLVSAVSVGISSSTPFISIRYNPCDSFLYGVIYDTAYSFARFHTTTGLFDTIATLPSTLSFNIGSYSILDADAGIYSWLTVFRITTLDLQTGQILHSVPIVDLPNEMFTNMALECSTHELIGTSATASGKILSTIDPVTGIVSHITGTSWSAGHAVPGCGGQYINQSTGDYFYSGIWEIVGVNTVTGSTTAIVPLSPGDMNYVQTFLTCNCMATGIPVIRKENIHIFPSPFSTQLTIRTDLNEALDFVLYDVTGRIISQMNFSGQVTVDTRLLDDGIYFYSLINEKGVRVNGSVLKQE